MGFLRFQDVALGTSLINLAVLLTLVLRTNRPDQTSDSIPISATRILTSVLWVGVLLLLEVGLLRPLGLGSFGMVHLAYLFLVITLPSAGILLLVAEKGRRQSRQPVLTPPVRLLAGLAGAGALVGIYATFIEPFRLQVERAELGLSGRRDGRDPIRIGVLTDLQTDHVTDYESSAIDRLTAERPDLILLPGDIFQGEDQEFERELPALRRLLSRLYAPAGVFVVEGDTECGTDRLRRLVESTSIHLLDYRVTTLEYGDRRLTIGGLGLDFASDAACRVISELESDPRLGDVRILLAHRPDAAQQLQPNSRIDLVIAGHTHGGQIVVPGFGPPLTLTRVPRVVAAGGLHQLDGNTVYVSRGVGCERGQAPRIRLFCPPEVSLLRLRTESEGPDRVAAPADRDSALSERMD
jgi:predicted MPP superfamily phosphohydrolase